MQTCLVMGGTGSTARQALPALLPACPRTTHTPTPAGLAASRDTLLCGFCFGVSVCFTSVSFLLCCFAHLGPST